MALKNNQGNYIKLYLNDKVEIFEDETTRQLMKLEASYEEICSTYEKLINDALEDFKCALEEQSIDFDSFSNNPTQIMLDSFSDKTKAYFAKLGKIDNEFVKYKKYKKASKLDLSEVYLPIISLIYPNVKNTLIKPLETFYTDWQNAPRVSSQNISLEKVDDIYLLAKELKIFGETEDC